MHFTALVLVTQSLQATPPAAAPLTQPIIDLIHLHAAASRKQSRSAPGSRTASRTRFGLRRAATSLSLNDDGKQATDAQYKASKLSMSSRLSSPSSSSLSSSRSRSNSSSSLSISSSSSSSAPASASSSASASASTSSASSIISSTEDDRIPTLPEEEAAFSATNKSKARKLINHAPTIYRRGATKLRGGSRGRERARSVEYQEEAENTKKPEENKEENVCSWLRMLHQASYFEPIEVPERR